ncbi:hypothetical protein A2Z22_00520 [Candidatus Woesebacteria bacterium RBG_16_34_12]|uniref:Uncharacterized protein n=1 Tax=Candidatus Woesebacteria bacterium RBG_16_34_12 TaxID=1802480 RepID=A0A1F7XAU4_9BACT|nr:MAG: hypothetical protein A2Z22_00520 [Candidatus Woesebacteria bacterium RBG_16_34_12]
MGFKKLEPGEIRPSNWTRFIETFHQTCTKNEAYATWGGGHTAIYPFLQQTRSMNEVKEFFGNQATEKSEVLDHILNHKDKPTPAPAALLLASNTAPINLLLDIQAQVAAGETAAMMGREANIRQLEAAKTITRIARTTTIEVEEYWRRYEETYYREIRRLARIGAQRGKIGGDNIVSSYSGEISAEGGQSLPKDTQPRSFPRIKR